MIKSIIIELPKQAEDGSFIVLPIIDCFHSCLLKYFIPSNKKNISVKLIFKTLKISFPFM